MLKIRAATVEDAMDLAGRLREADLKEIRAAGNVPEESLIRGVLSPDPCYVAVDDDDIPHIILGTHPSNESFMGFVWMMASDGINDYKVQIARETHPIIRELFGSYTLLSNVVHADNEVHIRWLRWAGFKFLRKLPYNGNYFYEFAKLKE